MAIADVNGKLIVQGYNCFVRVNTAENATSANKTIGYVTSFQATEDFQVQEATVLGHLGPVAIDPQGYTCNIQIAAFISADLKNAPTAKTDTAAAIEDNMPDREDFMSDSGETKIEKFSYLEFYDKKNAKIIAKFKGVIVTSNGVQSEGNAYVRTNVSMRALRWDKTKTATTSQGGK
jgi:hypothetical protein